LWLRFFAGLPIFYTWVFVFLCQVSVHQAERLAWKILRYDKKSRFVRMGHCARTGLCCQTLAVELPASCLRRPWVVAFFQRYYALVHNFQPVGPPQGLLLPLSCGHLRDGHICSIYPYRPKLCREYPQLSFFGQVELHKGCGFWFLERSKLGSFEEKLRGE